MATILGILNSFPMPECRYNQWYRIKRERLVTKATTWHRDQQAGALSPTPLHEEAILNYYFTLLDTKTETDRDRLPSDSKESCLHITHSTKPESPSSATWRTSGSLNPTSWTPTPQSSNR